MLGGKTVEKIEQGQELGSGVGVGVREGVTEKVTLEQSLKPVRSESWGCKGANLFLQNAHCLCLKRKHI